MIPQSDPGASYRRHKLNIDVAITRVLDSGWYILGKEVNAFEAEFASKMDSTWCVGVANGTDAIELALRAAGVVANDYVITVSHTAVATVAAIARIGAHPLFVDIDTDSYTMDSISLEAVLSTPSGKRAKAIVVVHLYGLPADMPALIALAERRGLSVIEDCAQAHGAKLHGRTVGSWGHMGCFSFYPTKNLGALGDGGAVVGRSPVLLEKLKLLREYGWQTRYISDCLGFNSRLDEIQAAILREKLMFLDTDNRRRSEIALLYNKLLTGLPLTLPSHRDCAEHAFHQYVISTPNRDDLRNWLREHGVTTLIHYPAAVHQQPAFNSLRYRPVPLLQSEQAAANVLSLPMFPELEDSQVEAVANSIRRYFLQSPATEGEH